MKLLKIKLMPKKIDITGQRFGELAAIEPTDKRIKGSVVWKCRCSCGRECYVSASSLRFGGAKSCGCLSQKNEDLTGQRFGKLEVIEPTEKRFRGSIIWKCRCDCGNYREVIGSVLKKEHIVSCRKCSDLNSPEIKGVRTNSGGRRGVSWDKITQSWRAYIGYKKEQYELGHYENFDDAVKAREQAEEKYYSKGYRVVKCLRDSQKKE